MLVSVDAFGTGSECEYMTGGGGGVTRALTDQRGKNKEAAGYGIDSH